MLSEGVKNRRFVYEIEKGTGSHIDSCNDDWNTGRLWQFFQNSRDNRKRDNAGSKIRKHGSNRNRRFCCEISGRL